MKIRNSTYNHANTIDCEIEHPVYGWIPFTASPNDEEPHGREIYAIALALGPKQYVPPPAPPEPTAEELAKQARSRMVCSRFQAKAALLQAGLLDQVEAAISNSDATTKLAWAEAVEFRRTSPTIAKLGALLDLNDTQLDDLFTAAMAIEA